MNCTPSEPTYVRLTKHREFPGSSWTEKCEGFPGATSEGSCNHHIDAGYVMEGWFLETPCIGRKLVLLRFRRNGVDRLGLFTSSPVTFLGESEIHTVNSVYQIEHGDLAGGPEQVASS